MVFHYGTQAQRGFDDNYTNQDVQENTLEKLSAYKCVPSAANNSGRETEYVMPANSRFNDRVSKSRNTTRRKLLTSKDRALKVGKVRKFDSVTKEVLRRLNSPDEQVNEDGLGVLLTGEEWKNEVKIQFSGQCADARRRKREILKQVQEEQPTDKQSSVGDEKICQNEPAGEKTIDDLVKESPFYKHNTWSKDPKKYFEQLDSINHDEDVQMVLEEAVALYDTSLNGGVETDESFLDTGSSFYDLKVRKYHLEDELSESVDKSHSVIVIDDDDSDKNEVPNTTDDDNGHQLELTRPPSIIEIGDSTTNSDNEELLVHETPDSPNITNKLQSIIEIPNSSQDEDDSVEIICLDATTEDGMIIPSSSPINTPSQSPVKRNRIIHMFDDIQEPKNEDTDDSRAAPAETLSDVLKSFSVEMLARQMDSWGLKPLKSRKAMAAMLLQVAAGIPAERLAQALATRPDGEILSVTQTEREVEGLLTGTQLQNQLVEHMLQDREIRRSIALYRPLQIDRVLARLRGTWSGMDLDAQWLRHVLDRLGVCWTPVTVEDGAAEHPGV